MRLRVQQVNVPLEYDDAIILQRASRKLGCAPSALSEPVVVRRSLDARARNPEPVYALTVEVTFSLPELPGSAPLPAIEILGEPEPETQPSRPAHRTDNPRPIVVGAGPAGLMAAYQLAMAGARPILIERGEEASARTPKVAQFWNDGILDPESNVLYGEGGAGLFSDGKLTARSKERGRIREFMKLLHECGADESVLIDAEPHVGSDRLLEIVPRLRERIIAAGGEVRFQSRLDAVIIESGVLRGVVINGVESDCRHCVLAVGHSARDVYAMLAERGVTLQPKPFAVGIRLEIPQAAIDRGQYGRFAGSPLLGAASFRLTRREENGVRSCYSFCMCPGGKVISCASEPGMLTTNGMSYSKRSLLWGNAAFLVPVVPADYPEHAIPALAGVEFQRKLEKDAFAAAGGKYGVAAVSLVDFLARRVSRTLPDTISCPRSTPLEFRTILSDFVTLTLEKTIPPMLKELNSVKVEDAILYAPETRSSSPLWITRNPDGESVNTRGLYPVGEGAGYAGGIVSSALDGMRAAEHVVRYLWILVFALALPFLSGCKPTPPPLPKSHLPRVISLAPSITEIVCAIGAADQLAGRSSACDYPPDAVARIPVIGDFGVPSLERILIAKPDAVLYTDLADMSLDMKLRRVGLQPAKIACSRLNEIPAAISQVGHFLHQESKANALAADLQKQIEACRAANTNANRPRVLVLIWNDPLTAAGKETFISDLVTLAGGRNIGDEINRDYFQVSGEWVLARDPEIIFCCFMSSGTPVRQIIRNLPGWSRITAVRKNRIYDGFDNNLIVRPGPRVMQGLMLIRPYISMDTDPDIKQTQPVMKQHSTGNPAP